MSSSPFLTKTKRAVGRFPALVSQQKKKDDHDKCVILTMMSTSAGNAKEGK
jgi:hypothetical protein